MDFKSFLPESWPPFVLPVLLFFAVLVGLLLVRSFLFSYLYRESKKGTHSVFLTVLNAFRSASFLWIVALALHAVVGRVGLSPETAHWTRVVLQLLIIGSVCLASSNALELLLHHALNRVNSALVGSGLIKGLVRSLVFLMGLLVAFSRVGIHIGPMLTALGVGGVAVGLALQDTLSNIFAGVNLVLDRAVTVGDMLKLSTGQEGQLLDIGWRTSKMLLENGDTLIVPNLKLAQDITVKKKSSA